MRPSLSLRSISLHSISALLLAPFAASPSAQQTEKDYHALTNTWHTVTNFNVEVVRGMAIVDTTLMYAVHPAQSAVLKFAPHFYTESARWNTLNGPVSVATYDGGVYVVCQASNALVHHDPNDGHIVDVISTLSEPSDLVVDAENGWAWVSCMGSDAVLRIQLSNPMRILDIWSWGQGLRVKRPRFLSLDLREPGNPADNAVWVAPLVSGNNTLLTEDASDAANNDRILDGRPSAGILTQGLPDEDLFLIAPGAAVGQQVSAMATGMGSLLTAHGRHPISGDYWMLNVNHRNAATIGEPAARGVFADNRVSIIRANHLPTPGAPPVGPDVVVDIDDLDPTTNDDPGYPATYVTTRSAPFPYALTFLDGGGAVVSSSMNHLLVVLDANGERTLEASTDSATFGVSGAIPRSMGFDGPYFLVYCQGTNNIVVYEASVSTTEPIADIALGEDPTPASIRHGREIWYDASRSKDGRTSCNTCHPQALADGLAWEISGLPVDDKGPMVTQPLCGIEDTFPYHWRGERRLDDFNVFRELLGGPANLAPADMQDFMAFLFSLTCPPNPGQFGPPLLDSNGRLVLDLDRKIKTSLTPAPQGVGDPLAPSQPKVGNPVEGDRIFHEVDSDQFEGGPFPGACVNCHTNPTSGNGDWTTDSPDRVPSKSNIEVTHLDNQLQLKRQPLVSVLFAGSSSPVTTPLLGFGTSHTGGRRSTFDFVNRNFPSLDDQSVADVNAFMDVFDQGIAPATDGSFHLAQGSPPSVAARIQSVLIAQAELHWIGVVVIGRFPLGGVLHDVRWYYDPDQDAFVPEDAALSPPLPFPAFADFSGPLDPDNFFFGVPPGNERRLAVDWDDDGLDLGQEHGHQCDPWRADTDGDGWPDGYEVANNSLPNNASSVPFDVTPPALDGPVQLDFVNAALAKFRFQTDEPTTWTLTVSTPNAPTVVRSSDHADTIHTAIVQGLEPSTIFGITSDDKINHYTGTLVLRDLQGNPTTSIPLPQFDSGTMAKVTGLPTLDQTVVGQITYRKLIPTPPNNFKNSVRVRVDWREQGPPALPAPDQIVIGQLLQRDANGLDWNVVPGAQIVTDATAREFDLFPENHFWGGGAGFQNGDLLVLPPTDASGFANVRFTVPTGNGKEFMFNVVAIAPKAIALNGPSAYDPAKPIFDEPLSGNPILFRWFVPATMIEKHRGVTFVQ